MSPAKSTAAGTIASLLATSYATGDIQYFAPGTPGATFTIDATHPSVVPDDGRGNSQVLYFQFYGGLSGDARIGFVARNVFGSTGFIMIGDYRYGSFGWANNTGGNGDKIANLGLGVTVGPGLGFNSYTSFGGYGTYYSLNGGGGDSFGTRLVGFTSGESAYVGFVFVDGSDTPLYGWMEMILIADRNNTSWEIVRWAIDDSGAPIQTGQTVVPEPAAVATGLGALALGAAGLRRWRKNRQQAQ